MQRKNRGALTNPAGRFEKQIYDVYDDGWYADEEENLPSLETVLFPEQSKSIITHNDSPDISFEQSINPYRGCEHGCIYCYARPSHAYVNLSPGLDFETKIFYKVDAAKLLTQELNKPTYNCKPIVIGANTDPYQPIENKLEVTRSLLQVLNKHNHPVILITKSSMILRDMDIFSEMAARNLIRVAVSITTLSNSLKLILEPRTSGPKARLRVVKNLAQANIPVRVMVAPVIPMVNDMELEKILKHVSEAGATSASYVLLRLPHEVKTLFQEWLAEHYPQRKNHVMSIIKQMRGGKEYDSTFGMRMRGEGEFAKFLERRFEMACKRFNLNQNVTEPLNCHHFTKLVAEKKQLDLFV